MKQLSANSCPTDMHQIAKGEQKSHFMLQIANNEKVFFYDAFQLTFYIINVKHKEEMILGNPGKCSPFASVQVSNRKNAIHTKQGP